jgi:alkylated DNA repair dioxygenase AlkB
LKEHIIEIRNHSKMSKPNGLTYTENVITDSQHDELVTYLMDPARIWTKGPNPKDGGRLVQQFGYYYDYASRSVDKSNPTTPIPQILETLNKELIEKKILTTKHNQIIVNFYQPGQGITAHRDHTKIFGNEIATISLGSTIPMIFRSDEKSYEQLLKPCSIAVLKEDARWVCTHEILARKTDIVDGKKIERSNRMSITYRNVIL